MKRGFGLLGLVLVLLIGCQQKESWTPLFNGKDLDGWHVYGKGKNYNGWVVQNNVLAFDPNQRTDASSAYLVSDQQFTNFELSLEWMISENGNSGVFWGVIEEAKYEYPYLTGPEIQILDDNYTAYIEERGDINRAASLYNLMAPSSIESHPANQWNKYLLHIDQDNNEGFLIFNDVEVLRFPVNGEEWRKLIAQSGFAETQSFGTAQTGHIALQDHGGMVAFRNIKIRELP